MALMSGDCDGHGTTFILWSLEVLLCRFWGPPQILVLLENPTVAHFNLPCCVVFNVCHYLVEATIPRLQPSSQKTTTSCLSPDDFCPWPRKTSWGRGRAQRAVCHSVSELTNVRIRPTHRDIRHVTAAAQRTAGQNSQKSSWLACILQSATRCCRASWYFLHNAFHILHIGTC